MPFYYKGFDHTNASDDEETVVKLTSTAEEKKKIVAVGIVYDSNDGILKAYVEREAIVEDLPTGDITEKQLTEIPVGIDLPEGQTFKVTLKNKVAGTNATIRGYIKYEIT